MTPDEFLANILDPNLKTLQKLDGPRVTDPVRVFLTCVALQESGPDLDARYQSSPNLTPGPARGWFQFEQGGGVKGVMTHQTTRKMMERICAYAYVQPNQPAVWRALEGHDFLAVAVARMLLLTDPPAVPTNAADGWEAYAVRLWRPGKPHSDKWPGNWARAEAAVKLRPLILL